MAPSRGGVGSGRDVEPSGAAGLAPRAGAELFELLFEHGNDGIMLTRPDGQVLRANPAACRILGRSEDELRRLGRDGLVVDDGALPGLVAARQARGSVTGELRLRRGDGSVITVDLTSALLPASSGGTFAYNLFRDVTAQRRAEAEALEARRLAAATLDAMPEQVCVLDGAGTLIGFNASWRAFAEANGGVPEAVLLGCNYLEVCRKATGPDSQEAAAFAAGLREVLSGERSSFSLEYPCHSPQVKRWFVARVTRFPEQDLARVVVAHHDISALKRVEEALRESSERFEAALASSSVSVFTQDPELRYTWIHNPGLGLGAQEYLGKRDSELFARRDDALVTEALKRDALASGSRRRGEVVVHDRGEARTYDLTVDPRRGPKGEVRDLIGVAVELTEQKRAEEALARSEARYRALADRVTDLVFALDGTLRVTFWSQACARVTGIPQRDAEGRSLGELAPLVIGPDGERACLESLQVGETRSRTVEHHLDGGVRVYDLDCYPAPDGLTVFARDATDRRAKQARANRMERLSALGSLVAGVAHEINNPLVAVLGNLDFAIDWVSSLDRGSRSRPPEEVLEALSDAVGGGKRIRAIVSALQAIAAEPQAAEARSDVGRAVNLALTLSRHALARCEGVTVSVGPLPPVALSEADLVQLLVNLLVNAGQATADRPNRVSVDASREAQDRLQLRVVDTGSGMSPSVRERAFDPFFTSRGPAAKGLGLAVSRGIVESVGGDIRLESTVGKGTTVVVSLPFAEGGATSP